MIVNDAPGDVGPYWRCNCFGVFTIDTGDGPVLPPISRKARGLLAWLALNHLQTTRDRLTGLLWSNRGEVQARQSLRQTLTEIRQFARAQALPVPIIADRDHIVPAPGAFLTDVMAFRHHADAGDLTMLAGLLGDCPLQLLEDLDGIDPAFDDWLAMERPRQHDIRVAAALSAVRHAIDAGRHAMAAPLLLVLRAHDASHEGIAHAAMQAAYAGADRDGLRHILAAHQHALRRDLDTGLAPETRALFDRLMAADWQSAAPESVLEPESADICAVTGLWIA